MCCNRSAVIKRLNNHTASTPPAISGVYTTQLEGFSFWKLQNALEYCIRIWIYLSAHFSSKTCAGSFELVCLFQACFINNARVTSLPLWNVKLRDSQVFPWPSSNKSKSPWEKRRSVQIYCKFDPLVGKNRASHTKFVSNEIILVNHHLEWGWLLYFRKQNRLLQTISNLSGTCPSKVARDSALHTVCRDLVGFCFV